MNQLLLTAGYHFSHESKHLVVYFKGGLTITINKSNGFFKCHYFGVRLDVSAFEIIQMGNGGLLTAIRSKLIKLYKDKGHIEVMHYLCKVMGVTSDALTYYTNEIAEYAYLERECENTILPNFKWN